MAGFRLAALVFALTFLVLATKSNANDYSGDAEMRDFQEGDLGK